MNQQEMKIIPPEGYEVDKENSTFECIKFKPIKPPLPTTWEEFCKTHPLTEKDCWVAVTGRIHSVSMHSKERFPETDRTLLPSKEYAEAMLALCQLIQLRECYNDGWKPDWTDKNSYKFCLSYSSNNIVEETLFVEHRVMAFKTRNLRKQFLENFKDLIEIAKPLL
jgi:hypothetical protein